MENSIALNLSSYLDNYFRVLAKKGYLRNNEVKKLLLLSFLDEVLDGSFIGIISEEDYRILIKGLDCIYGSSCIMPFPSYAGYAELMKESQVNNVRITEDCFTRITEDVLVRTL